ncbi:MAG: heme-copper oxidase subunit III [Anaerolineae bacterium]|nr:heme-copper oxidase subunit III [Anaerolineae bacterium]
MQQQVLEQNALSRQELQDLRNKRTGVTMFQFSWILVFVCLIIVNLQIRGNFPSWPPPGVQPLDPVLPTLATVGLLASAVLARGGLQAIRRDRHEAFRAQWRAALALGTAFVLVMAFEWVTIPFSGQFSTVFRVMTAYHGIHALVIGLIMVRVYSGDSAYDSLHHWAVEASTKLWYFVVVAWLLFYTVLYLI